MEILLLNRSNPVHGEVYSIQHYVIKFVSDMRQWFSPGTPVSSTNKTNNHHMTEICLESGIKHHYINPNNSFKLNIY